MLPPPEMQTLSYIFILKNILATRKSFFTFPLSQNIPLYSPEWYSQNSSLVPVPLLWSKIQPSFLQSHLLPFMTFPSREQLNLLFSTRHSAPEMGLHTFYFYSEGTEHKASHMLHKDSIIDLQHRPQQLLFPNKCHIQAPTFTETSALQESCY